MSLKIANPYPFISRAVIGLLGCAAASGAVAAKATITRMGTATVMTITDTQSQAAGDPIDYVNARPFPMPIASGLSSELTQSEIIGALVSSAARSVAAPVVVRGSVGDGKESPLYLGKPKKSFAESDAGFVPQEAGTQNLPFTTARADGFSGSTNKTYPFRAAGKLFFKEGSGDFICSASLIKKGIVVTAAHCVSDFGKNKFYSDFSFVPGYKSGSAPYGKWAAKSVWVVTSYLNGSDQCSQSGVVCKNDVAVIVLAPQGNKLPGTNTGWYGFAYNNAGFTSNGLTHITQIGYPLCLDNAEIMERNDAQGFQSASNAGNTLIGSLMCSGSSGGPWLVNFGKRPALTGTSSGSSSAINTVIGVTSWGATATGPKQQGASPFLNSNIQQLVDLGCNGSAPNCAN